ncbi:CAMK family protein kinase [Histomonas meleagridis]|uniref:CAMK family protein kinase n=1 Tax=Histomonas meleagridis TaxID=135588 RepID=UPI00355A5B75|nr:CAMK family protein kinase [Histomonas meleagridis]KAH0798052.1 CAMK family protein kinase [Histomonas meleagridis]
MYKKQIFGYLLGRTLGTGTTGKVKLAERKDDGTKVAIKIIKKSAFTERPGLEKKIRREIALMRLFQHPSLLELIQIGESAKHIFIVMEYAVCGELFDYLVSRQNVDQHTVMKIFRQLIYGLEYIHKHGICHRDIKPENILLDEHHNIKIADFGLARWMSCNVAKTSCGSPHYSAPEVIKNKIYDGRMADVWSCGVVLYALLTVCF